MAFLVVMIYVAFVVGLIIGMYVQERSYRQIYR